VDTRPVGRRRPHDALEAIGATEAEAVARLVALIERSAAGTA
jgi:hypothetical protein